MSALFHALAALAGVGLAAGVRRWRDRRRLVVRDI